MWVRRPEKHRIRRHRKPQPNCAPTAQIFMERPQWPLHCAGGATVWPLRGLQSNGELPRETISLEEDSSSRRAAFCNLDSGTARTGTLMETFLKPWAGRNQEVQRDAEAGKAHSRVEYKQGGGDTHGRTFFCKLQLFDDILPPLPLSSLLEN